MADVGDYSEHIVRRLSGGAALIWRRPDGGLSLGHFGPTYGAIDRDMGLAQIEGRWHNWERRHG